MAAIADKVSRVGGAAPTATKGRRQAMALDDLERRRPRDLER